MESSTQPPDGGSPLSVGEPGKDEINLAVVCHLLSFAVFLVPIPGLGPLILWLIKKDSMPFVDEQGKEAINFNITVLIAMLVCLVTVILIPMMYIMGIAAVIMVILAAVKVSTGAHYRYPFILRLIK